MITRYVCLLFTWLPLYIALCWSWDAFVEKNYVANPELLKETDQGQKARTSGNLAMPITNIRDEMKKMSY